MSSTSVPRIVCIHAMQPSLVPTARAFREGWPEADVVNLLDDSLAPDVDVTGLDDAMHERFSALGQYAVSARADAVLFTCSAFGGPIERVQAELKPMPVLKPNETMQRVIVERGGKVAVLSMFEPTLPSITRELAAVAAAAGAPLEVLPQFVPSALAALNAGDEAACAAAISSEAVRMVSEHAPDTVALAMFSMAFARPHVEAALAAHCAGVGGEPPPVLTSPDLAISELRERLARPAR